MPKYISNKTYKIIYYFNKSPEKVAYLIFIMCFALYLFQITEAELNGDCVSYATIIENNDLNSLPTHLGYFLIGIIFNRILPFNTILSLDVMSSIFGAIGVALIYLLTLKLTKKIISGLVASGALMFSGYYWIYAMYNEIYVAQATFISLTYLFWLSKREYLSGLSFLVAMLISPLSLLALPGIVMDGINIDKIWKRIAKFSLFSLPLYIIVHAYYWGRFFAGRSSLSGSPLTYGIPRNLGFFLGSFSFTLFLLLFAMVAIYAVRRKFLWSLIGFISTFVFHILVIGRVVAELYIPMFPITAVIIGLGFDNLYTFLKLGKKTKIRIYILFSLVVGIFIILTLGIFIAFSRFRTYAIKFLGEYDPFYLPLFLLTLLIIGIVCLYVYRKYKHNKRKRWEKLCYIIAVLVLFLTAMSSLSVFVSPTVNYNNAFRSLCLKINEIRSLNSVVLASHFTPGMLYKYYTQNDKNLIFIENNKRLNSNEELDEIIDKYEEVWLLGKYSKRNLKRKRIDLNYYCFKELKIESATSWRISYDKN